MKKFAIAIMAFDNNGILKDVAIVFVDAESNLEAFEIGMGKSYSLFPQYKYASRACTVREIPS